MIIQAKKSKEDLKEVTHKVFFDVEIAGKPAGMFLLCNIVCWLDCKTKFDPSLKIQWF